MAALTVEIVTPERMVTREQVDAITLPTPRGMISILPHHEPYLGALAPGAVMLRKAQEEQFLSISGGVIEIRDGHHVKVLVETAERQEEIDVSRAEEARQRALELRKQVTHDDEAFARASAALEKELARLRVARRLSHRGHHGSGRGVLHE